MEFGAEGRAAIPGLVPKAALLTREGCSNAETTYQSSCSKHHCHHTSSPNFCTGDEPKKRGQSVVREAGRLERRWEAWGDVLQRILLSSAVSPTASSTQVTMDPSPSMATKAQAEAWICCTFFSCPSSPTRPPSSSSSCCYSSSSGSSSLLCRLLLGDVWTPRLPTRCLGLWTCPHLAEHLSETEG